MARIIIVDDDEMVVEVARAALEARGHIVGSLPDGLRVRDVVRAKQPDLVILDCAMPEMSGVDALRQLRGSLGYETPVLMLTSRRSGADEEIAIRAGADDYMRKPFNPDQLVAWVETMLAKSPPAGSRPGL